MFATLQELPNNNVEECYLVPRAEESRCGRCDDEVQISSIVPAPIGQSRH